MVKFEKNTDGNWVVSAGRRQFVVENWEDFILAVSKVDKLKGNGINSLSVDNGAECWYASRRGRWAWLHRIRIGD